ncbi:MAG TPA: DUF2802 domain-containing protein [Chromatiales bacterium]|nr:DUF2802 domain-containing protein [Chromatiales bacterium]
MTLIWTVVFGIGTVLLSAGAALGWSLRRQRARFLLLQKEIEALNQTLNALCSGAVGVDRRIVRLEQRERNLEQRQESLEQQKSEDRPYGDAIERVRQGAPIEQLMKEYGFSRNEAELMVRLHRDRETG